MPERMTPEEWDRVVAGREPSEVDLLRAPVLNDWYPTWRRGAVVVVGRVSYHHEADGTPLQTSEVLRFAEDGSWLRTRREYYRLGRRFVRKSAQEIAEQVLGPGRTVKQAGPPPGWTDHFPDLPLPPMEGEDTSQHP